MRAIDADALIALVKGHGCDKCPGGALQCTFCTLNQFIVIIDSVPTLDVQPVRRGEWVYEKIGDKTHCFCSECGDQPMRFEPNYCPNCGADMRQEEHQP